MADFCYHWTQAATLLGLLLSFFNGYFPELKLIADCKPSTPGQGLCYIILLFC